LKNFLKTIDQKILNPDTRFKSITYLYMAFAAFLMLHHIYVTIYHKDILTGAPILYIPFIIFAVMNFFMGKLWKDWIFWVFSVLLILKVVRTAMWGEDAAYALEVSVTYFVMSVYAFFGCYAVARVIPRDKWKAFLSILCFLWTAAALVLAILGIKVAITGVPIDNLGTLSITIASDRRLALFYQPVIAGILMSICMSFALFGCILSKNKFLKLFYILASLVFFFTGSLTGTRTAYVLSGVNLALLLYIPLNNLLKPGKTKGFFRNSGKHILLVLSCFVIAAAIAYAESQTIRLLPYIKARGGLFISTAYAESPSVLPNLDQRGFVISANPDLMINGRFVLWGNVLEVVFANIENFLLGVSVYNTMVPVYEIRYALGLNYLYHTHNIYLQHLLENGLPAFILYISFILAVLWHGIRLLMNRDLPAWQRVLPVTAFLCALEGMIDTTCHVNFGYPQMTLLYLFAGFTITLSRQIKKEKDASVG